MGTHPLEGLLEALTVALLLGALFLVSGGEQGQGVTLNVTDTIRTE